MPAAHQDHRVQGIALIAPHFIVEDISVEVDRRDQDGLRDHEPEREARALAQGRRQRLLRLERRLARSKIPRLGYFRLSRLYPRAGRDPAGRGRPVRHHAAGRDRAGGVLLPGRCDRHCQAPATRPHREAPEATLEAIADFAAAPRLRAEGARGGRPRPLADRLVSANMKQNACSGVSRLDQIENMHYCAYARSTIKNAQGWLMVAKAR